MSDSTFDVFHLAFDKYRDTRYARLEAESEAQKVTRLLADWGGKATHWSTPPEDRDLTTATIRLGEWSNTVGRNSMLLWFGHGYSNQVGAWLVVTGAAHTTTDPTLVPESLADHVHTHILNRTPADEEENGWTLVLLEACGAERFLELLSARLHESRANRRLLLVASGSDLGRGYLGDFRRALAGTLEAYGANSESIGVYDLAKGIDERLESGTVSLTSLARAAPLVRSSGPGQPVAAPMDVFERLQSVVEGLSEHDRDLFARRNTGSSIGELTWNFAGRTRDREAVARWMDERDGMLVVTGPAGTGKSALLGNLLLHSRPELAEILTRDGLLDRWLPEDTVPPSFDASVHLTGASLNEVVDRVTDTCGLERESLTLSASERTNALLTKLRERDGHRLRLLIDALDEAHEPLVIAAFLRQLAGVRGTSIVVGVRASPEDNPTSQGHRLIRALTAPGARLPRGRIHWLESDPDGLAEYVHQGLEPLRPEHAGGSAGFDSDVGRVTALVTEGGHEFLQAKLALREILAAPALLTGDRAEELTDLLTTDHRRLFEAALDRICVQHPDARPALAALALARGRGLPRAGRVWATAASALGERRIDDTKLSAVLQAAAPYVLVDAEHGQGVYRLAHQAFQEHFLRSEESEDQRRRLAEALLALARENMGEPLSPYLRHHLSGHVVSALPQPWERLAEDDGLVLDMLHPRAIVADVMSDGHLGRLPSEIVGAVKTAYLARSARPEDRYGLRSLGVSRALGSTRPRERSGPLPEHATWEVTWARLRPSHPHLTLAGHSEAVRDVTPVSTADGDPLLATASHDGTVRLWNPRTGHSPLLPLTGHTGTVFTATGVPGPRGRGLLVTTGGENRRPEVLTWSVQAGQQQPTSHLTESKHLFLSAAPLLRHDGQPLIALGSVTGPIKLFDPLSRRFVHRSPMNRHDGGVRALTALHAADSGSEPRLVSGDENGSLRLWDTGTGRSLLTWSVNPGSAVSGLAPITHGGQTHLVYGDESGLVCVWASEDLTLGAPPGLPPLRVRVSDEVTAVGVFPDPDLPPRVVLGCADGTLRLWSPFSPGTEPVELSGHRKRIRAITAFQIRSTSMLATSGDDNRTRVWPPQPQESSARPVKRVLGPSEDVRLSEVYEPRPEADPESGGVVSAMTVLPLERPLLAVAQRRLMRLHSRAGETVFDGKRRADTDIETMVPYLDRNSVWHLATGTSDGGLTATRLFGRSSRESLLPLFEEAADPTAGGGREPIGKPKALDRWPLPGGDLLVTGWGDGDVRAWKVGANSVRRYRQVGQGVIRDLSVFGVPVPTGGVEPVIAITANPGDVTFLSPRIGSRWREPLPRHQTRSLTAYRSVTGTTLLVTGSEDGLIRVWNPITGEHLRTIPIGLPCYSLRVFGEEIAVGTELGFLVLRIHGTLAVSGDQSRRIHPETLPNSHYP